MRKYIKIKRKIKKLPIYIKILPLLAIILILILFIFPKDKNNIEKVRGKDFCQFSEFGSTCISFVNNDQVYIKYDYNYGYIGAINTKLELLYKIKGNEITARYLDKSGEKHYKLNGKCLIDLKDNEEYCE